MDESTIRALNAINQRFYETIADDFDATRQQPWQGWNQLIPHLSKGISVLDAGCGNGRFGVFLAQRLGAAQFRYHGIDSSPVLLERAKQALEGIDARLELQDIVEQPLSSSLGQFDRVALFGVLHHIPSEARRQALLLSLAERLAPGGLLVFTEWRFMEVPKLRERVVAWDQGIQVEPGDYLLDWRRGAIQDCLRYCHHVDDAEHTRLVAATGLVSLDQYRADAANLYTILRQPLL